MYHINNFKVKRIIVLLCYNFVSEMLTGNQNKVELVEAVTDCIRKYWGGYCEEGGVW